MYVTTKRDFNFLSYFEIDFVGKNVYIDTKIDSLTSGNLNIGEVKFFYL